jgi:putative PIN family toxin of toxin-antitoxin system
MALRLVLDTNVVLDIFHWHNPGATPILAAARAGDVLLVTNTACLTELRHVVHRPRFGLTEDAADEIVGSYLALATRVDGAAALQPLITLPRCKDQDDQKFLELARDARAELLVTRDKALLTLARKKFALAGLRIVRPEEAVAMLAQTPGWH